MNLRWQVVGTACDQLSKSGYKSTSIYENENILKTKHVLDPDIVRFSENVVLWSYYDADGHLLNDKAPATDSSMVGRTVCSSVRR